MPNKYIPPVFAALVALLLIIWWRSGDARQARGNKADGSQTEHPPGSAASGQPAPGAKASDPTASLSTGTGETTNAPDREREQRIARLTAEADAELEQADVSMQFWGKVVDQTAAPVSAVEVAYETVAYVPGGRGRMTSTAGKVITDQTGMFAIEGVRGHALTVIQLKKAGYAAVGLDGRWFSYALLSTQSGELHQPDRRNPVVYKIARLEGAQPLLSYEYRAEIATDGTVRRSSTGNGLLAGAFRLQFSRGESADEKKTRYDWTFTLQLERGGVQRSVDEFMFEAPVDGYAEKLELVMKAANAGWRQEGSVGFFARTAEGKFGRFTLRVAGPLFADEPRAHVTIEGVVNPVGARNLEPEAR